MKSAGFLLVCSILVAVMVCFSGTVYGSEEQALIKKGQLLTLPQCIDIAIKNQPGIIASMSTLGATGARIGQAQSVYYPQISASGGYSKIAPVSKTVSRSYDQYTSSAGLTQNIYDFGKTSAQVDIQKLNFDAARSDLENVTVQIVFNVKQAYYGLMQAVRNRDVSAETVKQFQEHLTQAKGFYEVGTKPKFDVTKAEVDLSNARLNMIRAGNAIKLAMVSLNNAMGVPTAPEYSIEDSLAFVKFEAAIDSLLSKAFAGRADVKAISARRKAAEESVVLATKGHWPSVSGNASYNWSGDKFPLADGWNAGATVTFPIFSGFLTKGQVEESKANLNAAKANEESLKQTVVLEVQQAYLNLKEAEERVPLSELTVKQASETLDIANGRYAAGVGSPIEVTDAQVALLNAKTAYIQALSDYKIAQAGIEKALGVK